MRSKADKEENEEEAEGGEEEEDGEDEGPVDPPGSGERTLRLNRSKLYKLLRHIVKE